MQSLGEMRKTHCGHVIAHHVHTSTLVGRDEGEF